MACQGALAAGFGAQGTKADFTREDHLAALGSDSQTARRLVLLLGNTLGAFDPMAEVLRLREFLRPGDSLLVDGEIYASQETLAGYDNPLNRRFAWAPLRAVGIHEADGELRFEDEIDEHVPGLRRLAKHFQAGRRAEALIGGERLSLEAGERLEMNHSCKYTADAFLQIVAEAGLVARWQGTSDDGRFLMVLAAVD